MTGAACATQVTEWLPPVAVILSAGCSTLQLQMDWMPGGYANSLRCRPPSSSRSSSRPLMCRWMRRLHQHGQGLHWRIDEHLPHHVHHVQTVLSWGCPGFLESQIAGPNPCWWIWPKIRLRLHVSRAPRPWTKMVRWMTNLNQQWNIEIHLPIAPLDTYGFPCPCFESFLGFIELRPVFDRNPTSVYNKIVRAVPVLK